MQGHQKGSYKEGAIIAKAPSVLPVNSVVEHPVLTTEGTESTEVLNSYGSVEVDRDLHECFRATWSK